MKLVVNRDDEGYIAFLGSCGGPACACFVTFSESERHGIHEA